jgi:hypothetical protein
VQWGETGLVLADQLRDGNVPASRNIRELVDEAYASLPAGNWQVQVRSDSAPNGQAVLGPSTGTPGPSGCGPPFSSGLGGWYGTLTGN